MMPVDDEAVADYTACRDALRHGSRTFYLASFLLPRNVRLAASGLYAFCRMADDLIDLGDDPVGAIEDLTVRLDAIYAGAPKDHLPDRAMAHIVARHDMPRELLDALLEGFAWDNDHRRYETIDDLHAYAVRVAGVVGIMMSVLMDRREPATLARACELGVAMQLTNIARDVGEDARAGRLYLPLAWMREAGIDPAGFLAQPVFDDRLASVVQRLLDEAERLYFKAGRGIGDLPFLCRPAINAARLVYREIGLEVERRRYDSVSGRAVVSGRVKLRRLRHAVTGVLLPGLPPLPDSALASYEHRDERGVPAGEFAVQAGGVLPLTRSGPAWFDLSARVEATLELFETLERRDRLNRAASLAARRQR